MAGKTRDPDDEAFFWWKWTMIGALIYVGVVFAFILN
jgi:hypothetical protein